MTCVKNENTAPKVAVMPHHLFIQNCLLVAFLLPGVVAVSVEAVYHCKVEHNFALHISSWEIAHF